MRCDMRGNRMPQGDNRGLSLIELVVVVMILGIVAATAIMSLTSMMRANTTRAAKILSGMLDKARIEAMVRTEDSTFLRLYMEDGMYYADIFQTDASGVSHSSGDPELLGSGSLTFCAENGSESFTVTGSSDEGTGSYVDFVFKKSNGVLDMGKTSASDGTTGYTAVRISGAKTEVVSIVKNTGRNYVSQG